MPGLERRLKAEVSGDVEFDRFTRGRYATDASHYQIMPLGVVAPRTIEEAERAIGDCRAEGVAVLARGGGTSQAGQTVDDSLIVDCSKYLTRILDLDVSGARCTVEPGIVLDDLNRQLKPHGLWFPVDISTASRATIGGMAGNNSCGGRSLRYGTMRDNVLVDRRGAGRRHAGAFRPGRRQISTTCRLAAAAAGAGPARASARARPTRSPRAFPRCSAASAATTSTRWCRARTTSISRTSWSARRARSPSPPRIELKLSPVLGRRAVGACHFGRFHEAMDAAQHIVQARADRGRADRPRP